MHLSTGGSLHGSEMLRELGEPAHIGCVTSLLGEGGEGVKSKIPGPIWNQGRVNQLEL